MINKVFFNRPFNHGQEVLIDYLKEGMNAGKCFFKSKYIAQDLGMTSKEVGTNMKILSEVYKDMRIEKWSYSKSTTWRVEYANVPLAKDAGLMVKA